VPCDTEVSDKDEAICASLACGAQKEVLAWWLYNIPHFYLMRLVYIGVFALYKLDSALSRWRGLHACYMHNQDTSKAEKFYISRKCARELESHE
jgi:hypothetical protein